MIGNLSDPDSMLAAMNGIHTVFHLIATDERGRHARLEEIDVAGTRAVVNAALLARVGRLICVSRFGADRGSAFPVLRAKGEMEETIRNSGLAHTIFRSGPLFGDGDRLSEGLAMLLRAFPLFFVPGDGEMTLQPFWVEDLVTCLVMSLEDLDLIDRTLVVGGPEILTYRRMVMRVMHTIGSPRPIVSLPLLGHKMGAWFLDGLFARWPFTEQWVELLSTNQTGELGTVERHFGFRPAAFDVGVLSTYMRKRHYFWALLRYIFSTRW